jgi:hypothetical protein
MGDVCRDRRVGDLSIPVYEREASSYRRKAKTAWFICSVFANHDENGAVLSGIIRDHRQPTLLRLGPEPPKAVEAVVGGPLILSVALGPGGPGHFAGRVVGVLGCDGAGRRRGGVGPDIRVLFDLGEGVALVVGVRRHLPVGVEADGGVADLVVADLGGLG